MTGALPVKQAALVSIILPTYNQAAWIAETIASVQQQTYLHWELLIIDDGSDDNTGSIVNGIGDDRIFFYKAGRKGINGVIKNCGIEKARGQLIAFIDSDDCWHPEKLAKQVAAFDAFPAAGFVITGGYNFREAGKPLEYFYQQKEGMRYDDLFIALFRSEIAAFAQALMIKKECLAITGGFKESNSFSDVEFIIHLARHFNGIILYEPLLYRRLHAANYIHTAWDKSFRETLLLFRSFRHDPLMPPAILRDAFFRLYIRFGEKYLAYRQRGKAFRQFFIAWKYRPFSLVPLRKMIKSGFAIR